MYVTEQIKCYVSNSLGMVDPEIIAVNPYRQNIFYTSSAPPHTGDDKIKVLLLMYIVRGVPSLFLFVSPGVA